MRTLPSSWIMAAAAAIFILDLFIPLGVAVPMLYVLPILLSWISPGRRITAVTAGSCIILTLLGVVLSPGELSTAVAANRALASTLGLVIAWLVIRQKQSAVQVAEAHQAREESEEKFAKVFHASPHPIGITEVTTGRCIEVNDACLQLFGFSREEVIGSTTLMLGIWPNQQDRVRLVERLKAGEPIRNCALTLKTKSGDVRHILISSDLMEINGTLCMITLGNDITNRKQAEDALLEREQQFRAVFNQTTCGIAQTDSTGRYTLVNDRYCEIVGRLREELLTLSMHDITHADDLLANADQFCALVQGGPSFVIEKRYLRPDGSVVWVHKDVAAVRDNGGRVSHIVDAITDITDRKRNEKNLHDLNASLEKRVDERTKALRQEEQRFHGAFDHAPIGMALVAPDGRWLRVNGALCQIVGYTEAELLAIDFQAITHPDDLEADLSHVRDMLAGTIQTYQMEKRYLHKRGHIVHILLTVYLVRDTKGQPLYFISQSQDITERTQAEEQFRQVVESAPNGMLLADSNGIITLINAQLERYFGYDRHELVGQPVELLLPERFRTQHPAQRAAFYHNPQARAMGARRELFGRRKDGSEFPLEIGLNPIQTAQGQQVLAAIVDISTRKQAEEMLKEAAQELVSKNAELHEANQSALIATRAKSEFLATMSHEIRTPMNAIVGMAELLGETSLSPSQQEYVGRLTRASTSLLDLINNILDISKIEAGQLELESIAFDIQSLVGTIGELMAIHAHIKQLELIAFVHPDVPAWVMGDPTRLQQVIINLIGNAIKFTERGEVVLRIEPDSADPDLIRCCVSDTGIGVPHDKLHSIFDSFTQVDSSMTRKYGGTGLGLSISKRLVEHMGGSISADSTEGHGSTFSFAVRLPKTTSPPTALPLPLLDLRNRRLLIVDDTETNRMVIREHLRPLGALLVEASDGPAALQALDEALGDGTPFDVAILDYHTRGMNGLDLAQAIRKRQDSASLPLVLYASDMLQQTAALSRELGIDSFVYKPVSRRRLLESLAVVLHQVPTTTVRQEQAAHQELDLPPPCRILLVEDLEDNRDLVRLFLKDTSCQLEMAENGAIGAKKFAEGTYDLVLMDMQMPIMDGLQSTMVIRQWEVEQQHKPTPIIALTANAFSDESIKSLNAGCTAHLTKPIKKKVLLSTITQCLGALRDQAA
jgi:PAS domain S-box-containing protein